MVGIEFFYSLKEVLIGLEAVPGHIYECLLECIRYLAKRCSFTSYQFFFKALAQKPEDEEVGFMQFRISAEDVFYSVYLIFNKQHLEKGRGFIKQLGGFITPPDEFNSEIFIFMVRSMLLGITGGKE